MHAIFRHGNVTCLGSALEEAQDTLPTYRGQRTNSPWHSPLWRTLAPGVASRFTSARPQ
ncbi:MAG: Epi-inositol hydrolase (EC [uncultured Caballeronia sp.]|nr:MAG: Epi-inositol hydrolase (EC [uncultured Caballeronia sp.]